MSETTSGMRSASDGDLDARTSLNASRVRFKAASGIKTWDGWPDDVRNLLKSWNSGEHHHLSFRCKTTPNEISYCIGCQEWFDADSTFAYVKGVPVCDDCLIVHARIAGIIA